MPPIMDNSKDVQDLKDKYFDTSRKILSQEITLWIWKLSYFYFLEGKTNVIILKNWSNVKVKISLSI